MLFHQSDFEQNFSASAIVASRTSERKLERMSFLPWWQV